MFESLRLAFRAGQGSRIQKTRTRLDLEMKRLEVPSDYSHGIFKVLAR